MPFLNWCARPPAGSRVHRDFASRLASQIRDTGPVPFDRFVELALYDADSGFYAVHGQAGGRRGDFITSVEAGPLFAAVIADWLDAQWVELGRPTPFKVAEVGAGVGTLFRGVNRAAPACFGALNYSLVERSPAMRVAHQSLPTERWRSMPTLPDEAQHVVLANELLDNLAFGIAERVDAGWASVQVGERNGELALVTGERDSSLDHLAKLAPSAAVRSRVPVASVAAEWIEAARSKSDRVLIFDYAATTAELADRGQHGWLRTYAGHQRGSDPLAHIGQCDITHDVPIDQLAAATMQSTQADWLNQHGLPERVETARQIWAERGHIGDLEALVARSAINEAAALCDRSGLGGFVVLEWR